MDTDHLELKLVDSLQNSDLKSLAVDYAELGLDAILDDGILKEIPVIGTIQKLFSAGGNLRNRLFMKKLLLFLVNLADVPIEQRQKQIAKLAVNVEERQRVGENLMLLLDKVNNMSKPEMMARAMRAYLLEKIDVNSLQQLWHVIDVVNVAYIPELKHVYQTKDYSEQDEAEVLPPSQEYHHLAICGLLMFEFGHLTGPPKNATERINPDGTTTKIAGQFRKGGFKRNPLGALFVSTVL